MPGLSIHVGADAARGAFPYARLLIPTSSGYVRLDLDWRGDVAHVRWVAVPNEEAGLAALLRDMHAPTEPWQRQTDKPTLSPTEAVELLLPLARKWLAQPVRACDPLIRWLRSELIEPAVVH